MKNQIERCEECRGIAEHDIYWDCLPVPAFGNPNNPGLKVATIAINPSKTEFFDQQGVPKMEEERLPMLEDFKKERDRMGPDESKKSRERRDYYFYDADNRRRNFYHKWFEPLETILNDLDFGWSYFNGTAIHFDLVACTTKRWWRDVPSRTQKDLQRNCAQFFRQTLLELPEGTILLSNGIGPENIPTSQNINVFEVPVENLEPLVVWKGFISHERRKFTFLGWRLLAKYITPVQKAALVNWLQEHC